MKLFHKFGAWVSILPILLLPATAFAQLSKSTETLGKVKTKIGADVTSDLPTLIGGIIRVFLGVLGIIFVIYVVYAGYLWMTSSGDPAKVDKSKKMLGQAVIGIVIIVAAYAISEFVINQIIESTK
ncbi:hypothetical protein HY771_00520 [Candidatus Uhrbacteria bacterium]|nr:hypothetical protein [Candidatus Uhrbacteria bacterium]